MTARGARRFLGWFIAIIILALGAWLLLLRDAPQKTSNDAAWTFNHGSIGNEATQGIPYWIWRVMPSVFPDKLPGAQRGYSSLGIAWVPGEKLPVGFSQRNRGVIPHVAPNCAFCHQGSYRLTQDDPETVVTAGAGTRVNVEAYRAFLDESSRDGRFNASTIMPEIRKRYAMPLWERLMYRFVLIPKTRAQLQAQAAALTWAGTQAQSGLGRDDLINAMKYNLLGMGVDGSNGAADIMPLWLLGDGDATAQTRFGFGWDGLATDAHELSVASALANGMTSKSARGAATTLAAMEDFVSTSRPPSSPFSSSLDPSDAFYVDAAQVAAGAGIYQANCAECHDPGGARYRTPIPMVELGTDRARLDAWTVGAMNQLSDHEEGHDWGLDHFQKTNGYLAVGLDGLWLRGPYLHNGSVPNLAAMLLPPAERPTEFLRGSDLVDAKKGGFVSAEGADQYRPAIAVDTTQPGNTNTGHLWGTDLGAADKDALLAFLKTL